MKFYEIGPSIRQRRKLRGFTQAELAGKAGISRVTLSKLENGKLAGTSLRAVLTILDQLNLEFTMVEPGALPTLEELAERNKK